MASSRQSGFCRVTKGAAEVGGEEGMKNEGVGACFFSSDSSDSDSRCSSTRGGGGGGGGGREGVDSIHMAASTTTGPFYCSDQHLLLAGSSKMENISVGNHEKKIPSPRGSVTSPWGRFGALTEIKKNRSSQRSRAEEKVIYIYIYT